MKVYHCLFLTEAHKSVNLTLCFCQIITTRTLLAKWADTFKEYICIGVYPAGSVDYFQQKICTRRN